MPNPRLEYLLDRLTRGIIDPADREELLALIDDPANDEDLHDLIARITDASGEIIPLPDETSRAILETILRTPLPERARILPMRPLARWWKIAAASAILLACTFLYRQSHRAAPPPETATAPDLAPGTDKAVLTLGSGAQIQLDSAHTGLVAEQGSASIMKLANGQIAYTADAGTGGAIIYNTMTTPRGGQYKLTLPDGSRVWLNAASSIRYPTAFTGKTRDISITGEAYFEIVHKANQPFRVRAGDELIEDLGTEFNINAYPDEPDMRTTLLEGSVRLSHPGGGRVLVPGQQASAQSTGPIHLVPNPDPEQALAWKNGLFQFDRADIKTVMRQIARWYDVDVSYEGPIPDDRFWGKLPRDANASQVLRVLQKEQVHFRIEGKKIIVTK